MSAETAVRARLVADAAVRALISDRVYPIDAVPQKPTAPYVTYQNISQTDMLTYDGVSGLERNRIQLNQVATSQLGVIALGAAIKACLHGKQWIATDGDVQLCRFDVSRDLPLPPDAAPSPSTKLWTREADYFVHFRPTP